MEQHNDSILIQILGETTFTKVLDTLLDHPTYEYTKTELAEVNDISRSTLYRIWDKLEELNLLTPTKKVGSSQLYKLNTENNLVEKLYKFEKSLKEDEETQSLVQA